MNILILDVCSDDFEGRHFWLREEVAQAAFKVQDSVRVRLPFSSEAPLVEVSKATWRAAMKARSPYLRRKFTVPNEFFAASIEDATASCSLTTPSLAESDGVARAPPSTKWALVLCPEVDIEQRIPPDVTVEDLQSGLIDYARLLADQRWGKPVAWAELLAAYPSLLGGDASLRFHALVLTARLIVTPYPWFTRGQEQEEKIMMGVDELFPPLINQFFAAEEAIVAAQCHAEAGRAGGALACLRTAQQAYPRSLAPERLGEILTFGPRPRFAPHLELRLLAGIGIMSDEVSAEELCRRLVPRLHRRALKDYVMQWIRDFSEKSSHASSEQELLVGMRQEMTFVWRIMREARAVISSALQLSSPGEFFLQGDKRIRKSAVPDRVQAYLTKRAHSGGVWCPPTSPKERLERLGALEIDMEDLFRATPPCMARVLEKARTQHRLKNEESYPLSTWLAAIFPKTSAPDIARALFGGVMRGTSHEGKIISDLETGKRHTYAPFSCYKIIRKPPNVESVLACPYKDRASLPWQLDAEGNKMPPIESACASCYAKDKGLPSVSPPLSSPVDHVLFYYGQ